MTSTYRQLLRKAAATSDAAFAEYVSDLVFPGHLREAERFANRHPKGLVLEPRGHAKTTMFMHRAARRIGVKAGAWRLGILTAVEGDAESRSGAIRRLVESPRFGGAQQSRNPRGLRVRATRANGATAATPGRIAVTCGAPFE